MRDSSVASWLWTSAELKELMVVIDTPEEVHDRSGRRIIRRLLRRLSRAARDKIAATSSSPSAPPTPACAWICDSVSELLTAGIFASCTTPSAVETFWLVVLRLLIVASSRCWTAPICPAWLFKPWSANFTTLMAVFAPAVVVTLMSASEVRVDAVPRTDGAAATEAEGCARLEMHGSLDDAHLTGRAAEGRSRSLGRSARGKTTRCGGGTRGGQDDVSCRRPA